MKRLVWKALCERDARFAGLEPLRVVDIDVQERWLDLMHQWRDDCQSLDTATTVSYCSGLKGFGRKKKVDQEGAVYEDGQARPIEVDRAQNQPDAPAVAEADTTAEDAGASAADSVAAGQASKRVKRPKKIGEVKKKYRL